MKNTCKHCHFLSKENRPDSFSLSKVDREDLGKIPTHYSLKCWMGVWDEGVAPHAISREETISNVNRKHMCFFWPHSPNMLFKAAEVLQKRGAEYEQMKRSNLYTRIGLWVAAIGLLFGAIAKLLLRHG
jgi:hypothetical protein